MQSATFSSGIFIAFAAVVTAVETNFLRSGLIVESDVKALLYGELVALGASARTGARQHIGEIRHNISTMYTSLPKNSQNMLSHQVVRYALHRFFVHRHGWFIRGLEPNNVTWHEAGNPDVHDSSVMGEWVPSYLQDSLEERLGQNGTDLNQLSALGAAIEDLIKKEVRGRLEAAYHMYEYPSDALLTRKQVDEVILTYYVAFLNSGDFSAVGRKQALANTYDFISDYAGWAQAHQWLEDLKSKHLTAQSSGNYAFQHVADLLDKMGEDYYTFNDMDCEDLKDTLRKMQGKRPGRVRLSAFYNKGMYSHWDFSEKKDYLRSLGVLDESDADHPSVIIANYAMARPNCLDWSNLFTICCRNECEDLMASLESEIGSDTAEPARLASLVAAMPSATVASNRTLPQDLLSRLESIARFHGSRVPLHGRLFAQWMHHAYPLECPYPHEAGTVNPLTRGEWIKDTGSETEKATTVEMMEHIASDSCSINSEVGFNCADESVELPWIETEELLTWQPRRVAQPQLEVLAAQHRCPLFVAILASALAMMGLAVAVRYRRHGVAWRPAGVTVLLIVAAFGVGLIDGTLLMFVLGVGFVVAVANEMTAKSSPADAMSKQCV